MSDRAVVDSGFVYALLDSDDHHHFKAWALLKQRRWDLRLPPATFTEVFHIRVRDAARAFGRANVTHAFAEALRWLTGEETPFVLEEMVFDDYARVAELLDQYADTAIDYVDAVVLATAERLGTRVIMTTDQEHFRYYVPKRGSHFELPVFDA
jgi:predicted nucleic acid-binding protein